VRIGSGWTSSICDIYPLMHLQALMSSQFATLPSFTLYLAKVACPKDHVRASYIYIYVLATSYDQVGMVCLGIHH